MLELLLAASVLSALVLLARRRRTSDPIRLEPPVPDLPCPWCRAPTGEEDQACPSCGQSFG